MHPLIFFSLAVSSTSWVVDSPHATVSHRGGGDAEVLSVDIHQSPNNDVFVTSYLDAAEYRGKTIQLSVDMYMRSLSSNRTAYILVKRGSGMSIYQDRRIVLGSDKWSTASVVAEIPMDAQGVIAGFTEEGTLTRYQDVHASFRAISLAESSSSASGRRDFSQRSDGRWSRDDEPTLLANGSLQSFLTVGAFEDFRPSRRWAMTRYGSTGVATKNRR